MTWLPRLGDSAAEGASQNGQVGSGDGDRAARGEARIGPVWRLVPRCRPTPRYRRWRRPPPVPPVLLVTVFVVKAEATVEPEAKPMVRSPPWLNTAPPSANPPLAANPPLPPMKPLTLLPPTPPLPPTAPVAILPLN